MEHTINEYVRDNRRQIREYGLVRNEQTYIPDAFTIGMDLEEAEAQRIRVSNLINKK